MGQTLKNSKNTQANFYLRNLSYIWFEIIVKQKTKFMERSSLFKKIPVALLALGIVTATAGFQTKPIQSKPATIDTIPDRDKKRRDIDEALEELEKGKA